MPADPTGIAQGSTAESEGLDPATFVPERAIGLELMGELRDSGYRVPPALARRADGQTVQLTPLLAAIVERIDGRRTLQQIAETVSADTGRALSAEDAGTLVLEQLMPNGLLKRRDGTEPEVKRSNPLLRMRFKVVLSDPRWTRRITRPFAALFSPVIVVPVLLAFAVLCAWLLFVQGMASATRSAFDQPGLLFLLLLVTILSAGFHEFGHAAAAFRGGAVPGAMGAGLYLVWPAFYTDVTDSYRLGRGGRLRTDLGGLYFNAIAAVAVGGLWLLTRNDALLLVVVAQLLLMLVQLTPVVRADGYHILADLTGVPDLFQRIGPTLRGILPWHWGDPKANELKPWARAVVTVWVLIVVPLLALTLLSILFAFPRIVGTAWQAAQEQWGLLSQGASTGDFGVAAARLFAIIAILLPLLGMVYILVRTARQVGARTWVRTRGRPVRRGIALALLTVLLGGVAYAWWPAPGTYQPIRPNERGTVLDALPGRSAPASSLAAGSTGTAVAALGESVTLPGKDQPALAVVLLPRDPSSGAPAWVFPFNAPEPPRPGDNQALAVNTTDGSVLYDVAFALVWADGDTVDTTNEAYAFANCTGCTTVAVGFQVVLMVGDANVVVPQNLSAAANYQCVSCVTAALASQLVLTLNGPPDANTMSQLEALWKEIAQFGTTIKGLSLDEISARLEEYKSQITDLLEGQAAIPTPTVTADVPRTTATPAPTPTPTSGPGPGVVDDEPSPTPSFTPVPTPTPSPTSTPEGQTTTGQP